MGGTVEIVSVQKGLVQALLTRLYVLESCCLIDAVLCCMVKTCSEDGLVYDSQEHRTTLHVCSL